MKSLKSFFDEKTKFLLIFTATIMILAHGFCFANIMYSHDSLDFADVQGLGKVGLGRWLYPFLVHRRLIASPWLLGAFSILYVSLAVVLVTKTLELSKTQGICVSILFATNISLTSLFCTYIHDADSDCLALLLACFAAYASKKNLKVLNIIVPIISITMSLALYQAFICVTIGLYIYILICEASNSKKWADIKNVIFFAFKALFIMLCGTELYIKLMHVAAKHYMTELSSGYNGAENLSHLKTTDIINSIPLAYQYFRNSFLNITEYNSAIIVKINYAFILILFVTLTVYLYIHRKFNASAIILIPCIIVLPLGLNAINLVSFGVMHQLMIFSFCFIYLLPLIICSNCEKQLDDNTKSSKAIKRLCHAIQIVVLLLIFLIGYHNLVYSNGAYVYKKLVFDNTELHAHTIWVDINGLSGYIEGETPVYFVGEFSHSNIAYGGSIGEKYLSVLTGASNTAITYPESEEKFYKNILGRNINICPVDADIFENIEYIEMPSYPANGYCRMINNIVVVKL